VAHVVPAEGENGVSEPQYAPRGALLTVAEVAASMRVSNMTVYRLIKAGQLAAVRVGKNFRIREAEVERYLAERAVRVEGS
jgi:excisionase family DNA binding protein